MHGDLRGYRQIWENLERQPCYHEPLAHVGHRLGEIAHAVLGVHLRGGGLIDVKWWGFAKKMLPSRL